MAQAIQVSDTSSNKPGLFDMGPMRIEGVTTQWVNGVRSHLMTIRVGDNSIVIIVSPGGRSIQIEKNGVRLIEPESSDL